MLCLCYPVLAGRRTHRGTEGGAGRYRKSSALGFHDRGSTTCKDATQRLYFRKKNKKKKEKKKGKKRGGLARFGRMGAGIGAGMIVSFSKRILFTARRPGFVVDHFFVHHRY